MADPLNDEDVFLAAAGLGACLRERGVFSATIESCTGGLIARALTEVAGSSAWFDRGWITYSNEAKMDLVGVSGETLRLHGAVSESTAHEMAVGGLERSRAGLAMSVTGIAGPGGAVPGKPVGTVCFGWARTRQGGGRDVRTQTLLFEGDRAQVRRGAARHALLTALEMLSAEPLG